MTPVAAARAAFPAWAATAPPARARILFRFLMLLRDRLDEIAARYRPSTERRSTMHGARSPGESRSWSSPAASPSSSRANTTKGSPPGSTATPSVSPSGCAPGSPPSTSPAMVPMWMFPVAIACGNTFLLKPSERDPSAAVRIAELAVEAGLPAGVLERHPRRPGGGGRAHRAPGGGRGELRRLHAHCRTGCIGRPPRPASACRALGGAKKPPGGDARRGPRPDGGSP